MNLKGKYIVINKNNIKYIIPFLYDKGYKDCYFISNTSSITIEQSINVILGYFNSKKYGENAYLFLSDNFIITSAIIPINLNYFNINIIFRADKLKRILK